MKSSRDQFEEWVSSHDEKSGLSSFQLEKRKDGGYRYYETRLRYQGWKAAYESMRNSEHTTAPFIKVSE